MDNLQLILKNKEENLMKIFNLKKLIKNNWSKRWNNFKCLEWVKIWGNNKIMKMIQTTKMRWLNKSIKSCMSFQIWEQLLRSSFNLSWYSSLTRIIYPSELLNNIHTSKISLPSTCSLLKTLRSGRRQEKDLEKYF